MNPTSSSSKRLGRRACLPVLCNPWVISITLYGEGNGDGNVSLSLSVFLPPSGKGKLVSLTLSGGVMGRGSWSLSLCLGV